MRKDTRIPDEHHVVRHCKKRLLIREGGKVVGVYPEAFELRPTTAERPLPEAYLSLIYYEYFEGEHAAKLKACYEALSFTPKAKDGLIRLCAGEIRRQGQKRGVPLKVTHEFKTSAPAYATIRGLPMKSDGELNSLLAKAVLETVQVSEVLAGNTN